MTNYKEVIYNVLTGETIERPYTAEEIAEVEKAIADAEVEAQNANEKETRRNAVLEKLGLTEQEARLLLGGN
jgi:hypothetical protein